jgi:hypothetical protein
LHFVRANRGETRRKPRQVTIDAHGYGVFLAGCEIVQMQRAELLVDERAR